VKVNSYSGFGWEGGEGTFVGFFGCSGASVRGLEGSWKRKGVVWKSRGRCSRRGCRRRGTFLGDFERDRKAERKVVGLGDMLDIRGFYDDCSKFRAVESGWMKILMAI